MAVPDWNTDPAQNNYLGTHDLREGMTAIGSINDIVRELMAQVKVAIDAIPDPVAGLPMSGGALTGAITRDGQGAFTHYASGTLLSGKVTVQPLGTELPANPADGDQVWEY